MELPAAPPTVNSPRDLGDTVIARMDGSTVPRAPPRSAADVSRRSTSGRVTVTSPARPRLVVQLDAPGPGGVWLLSVLAPSGKGRHRRRSTRRCAPSSGGRPLGRRVDSASAGCFPALDRAGVQRRGQVALSQDEAWEFMTVVGPTLAGVGFDVRVPALSRRKATPSLRLFAEATAGSVVGAHQLSNVAWSVLFDDVELTAAEVAPARQAGPTARAVARRLGRGRPGRPRAGRRRARRARARHAAHRRRDPAPQHRSRRLRARRWRRRRTATAGPTTSCARAGEASTSPVTRPDGFVGELRTYQAEALAWIGFLDAAELGGCLALDMGLGKTPTVLAHLARLAGDRHGARHRPGRGRRQLGRRGGPVHARTCASSSTTARRGRRPTSSTAEIADADIVITTYATAVRDIDALAATTWRHDRARRGAGDQEPGERDGPAAAAHPGPHPPRAHRHADRERARRSVGDPRLHQPRPRRIAPVVHRPDVRRRRERAAGAERDPAVPPHEDASRRSPPSCPTRSTSSTTAR